MTMTGRIFILLVSAIVFGLAPATQGRADNAPAKQLMFPPANTPEARLVRVQIGPHIFDIPRNARDIEQDRTGKLDAMSMQVLFPTMEGLAPEVGRRMVFLGQEARDLQVLLSDRLTGSTLPSPEKNPARWPLAHLWGQLTDLPYTYNGAPSLDQLVRELDVLHIERNDHFGLTEFRLTNETPKFKTTSVGQVRINARSRMEDGTAIFADLGPDRVRAVIECSGKKPARNPSCAMDFTYRTIDVRLHFVKALLPDWRAIRDGFSRYLDERCVNC